MAKSGDTEAWKTTLGETIFTQCEKELNYSSLMKVEGLLAITLDNENVVVINVNKAVEVGKRGLKRTIDANRGSGVKMRKVVKMGRAVNRSGLEIKEVKVEHPVGSCDGYESDGDNETFDMDSSAMQVAPASTSASSSLINASIQHVQSYGSAAAVDTPIQAAADAPQIVVNADTFQQMTHLPGANVISAGQGLTSQKELSEMVTTVNFIQTDDRTIQMFQLDAGNILQHSHDNSAQVDEAVSASKGPRQPKKGVKNQRKPRKKSKVREKIYKCGVEGCLHSSNSLSNVKRHMRTHESTPEKIMKPFNLKYSPRPKKEKIHKCTEEGCDYSSISITNLARHSRQHTGKYLQCSQCDFKASSQHNLNIHVNCKHMNQPLVCKVCGHETFSRGGMQRHRNKEHTNDHKYSCEQCDKKFHFEDDFQGHLAVHQGLKPYKCPNCFRRFDYKSKREEHRKICMGEVQYLCEDCGIEFKTDATLRKHYKLKHVDVQVPCECGRVFPWRHGYEKHRTKCSVNNIRSGNTENLTA